MISRITLQHVRDYYRDGSALFFGLIFPLVMTVCLGNMLADLDNPDHNVGTIRIAYHAESADIANGADTAGALEGAAGGSAERAETPTSDMGATAAEAFAQALSDTDGVELSKEKSAADAEKKVRDEESDVAMIFAPDMSVKIYKGGDDTKNRTADAIARGFARESAAYATAYATLAAGASGNAATGAQPPGSADKQPPSPPATGTQTPNEDIAKTLAGIETDPAALTTDKAYNGRTRSMIDYYAVTMIVMICFMGGGIGGATGMYFARREGTLRRLAVSPKRGGAIFLDTVLGSVPGSIAQTLAVMLPATLIFGAHYAASPADNLLLFAFFALLGATVSAVFTLIGLFLRFNPYLIIMAILWTMLFISGSFSKDINIPGVSEFMPMSLANRAAFDLTLFGRPGLVLTFMAVLAVILAATCAVGSLALRRKEATL